MKVKEESEKAGLKLSIEKMKIMASSPSLPGKWMGKQWKQWQTLFSWAPKSLQMVTAPMKLKDTCSLEEKLWQPRQHIKKQRYYFANKGPYSLSYGFSIVMYGCESWIIKKAKHQRIDAFGLWCWKRLLWVPWKARRSIQSILKEISPENSLEGLMLMLMLKL